MADKRPYAPTANVVSVINRVRTRNLPDVVNNDFLRIAGITDLLFGRVMQAVHFLALVESDGRPSDKLRALAAAPEAEYKELLAGIVRDAYAEDFKTVDPSQDAQGQIVDAFRKYEPRSQTTRMVMLFLGLCREAGLQVKDSPRDRGMQASTARRGSTPTKPGFIRKAVDNGRFDRPSRTEPDKASAPQKHEAGFFGLREADMANLTESEFAEVWNALGTLARARYRRPKAEPEGNGDSSQSLDDEAEGS
jgi:hypothetical protein